MSQVTAKYFYCELSTYDPHQQRHVSSEGGDAVFVATLYLFVLIFTSFVLLSKCVFVSNPRKKYTFIGGMPLLSLRCNRNFTSASSYRLCWLCGFLLTHWGRVTHICVSKLTIIGSDNGLSPERRQANIWTNAVILLIGTLGTNFSEILSESHIFSFKKMHLITSSAKRRPFCLGLNVVIFCSDKLTPLEI